MMDMRKLRGFGPAIGAGSARETLRAAVGAVIALAVLGLWFLHPQADLRLGLYLIAPFGASAVLIFAVPNSPLAQPWSAVVGNCAAAAVGVAACMLIPDPVWRIAGAVGAAIAAMILLRAVHPPSGAVAMTAAMSPDAIRALGFHFVLAPVAIGTVALVLMGIVYARATGRHYPLRQFDAPGPHGTSDAPAPERLGLSQDELAEILQNYRLSLNLGVQDLARLIGAAEMQAASHRTGPIEAQAIMSRDLVTVDPETPLAQVADLFRQHDFHAIPVVEAGDKYLGVIHQIDLIRHARDGAFDLSRGLGVAATRLRRKSEGAQNAGQIMRRDMAHVRPDSPVGALLPLLGGGGSDAVPVLHRGRIAGIVTQTDLISALARQSLRQDPSPTAGPAPTEPAL